MIAEKCPMCEAIKLRVLREVIRGGNVWKLALCNVCGLHFTSPTPTLQELDSFYAGDYHSSLRTEGATEASFGSKFERYADALGRHMSSGRVVDIGCSTGLLVRILRDRGFQSEGIELNSKNAEWGRSHYNIQINTMPLEQRGYAPESLDAILMTDVLEHMQHPRDYLRMAAQFIKPGGLVLVTFPDIHSIESRYQYALSKLLGRDWLWEKCHVPLHVWEFTKKTAEACFASAGFRLIEFRRHQPRDVDRAHLAVKLLNLPLRPIQWPVGSRLFGTQMEFIIAKIE